MSEGDVGFAAGTLVHVKQGVKPIEDICVGDWVLSFPDDSRPPKPCREAPESQYIYRQVSRVFSYESRELCHVIAWDLANNIKEVIKAAVKHPFHVKDEGWIYAERLMLGCVLTEKTFCNLMTKKMQRANEVSRVINIEVSDFHSYFVGKLGVLVHDAAL